jgi:hypothetical protein
LDEVEVSTDAKATPENTSCASPAYADEGDQLQHQRALHDVTERNLFQACERMGDSDSFSYSAMNRREVRKRNRSVWSFEVAPAEDICPVDEQLEFDEENPVEEPTLAGQPSFAEHDKVCGDGTSTAAVESLPEAEFADNAVAETADALHSVYHIAEAYSKTSIAEYAEALPEEERLEPDSTEAFEFPKASPSRPHHARVQWKIPNPSQTTPKST